MPDFSQGKTELARTLNDKPRQAIFLTGLGETNSLLNDKVQARGQLEQALALWRELKDRQREAATLALLAGIYASLGDFQHAELMARNALALRRSDPASQPAELAESLFDLAHHLTLSHLLDHGGIRWH